MKIVSVVGARPNFMKIAPFVHAIKDYNEKRASKQPEIEHVLVHTGQHYDDAMSASFFESLSIPAADINLGVGSGSHAMQVGETMIKFEEVCLSEKPDWVVVVGDVNATAACSMTAKKLGIKVAHIEAGLRSFDMDMPEEINRLVTDVLSDLLLTPDELSSANLRIENREDQKIVFVGNIMIDTLEAQRKKALALDIDEIIAKHKLKGQPEELPALESERFGVITLHRPSNVDDKEILSSIVRFFIDEASTKLPLLWTLHPRTRKNLEEFGLFDELLACKRIILTTPLGYHDLLKLNAETLLMMTDSGGLQEECAVLGTPCLTLRWNTERPITLKENGGPSILVGNDTNKIRDAFFETLADTKRKPSRPKYWDGKTATRIVEALLDF